MHIIEAENKEPDFQMGWPKMTFRQQPSIERNVSVYSLGSCKLKQDPTAHLSPKHWQYQMLARTQSSANCHPLSLGVKNKAVTLEDICQSLAKPHILLAYDIVAVLLSIGLEEMKHRIHTKPSFTWMFMAALFIRVNLINNQGLWSEYTHAWCHSRKKRGDYKRMLGCRGLGWTEYKGSLGECNHCVWLHDGESSHHTLVKAPRMSSIESEPWWELWTSGKAMLCWFTGCSRCSPGGECWLVGKAMPLWRKWIPEFCSV